MLKFVNERVFETKLELLLDVFDLIVWCIVENIHIGGTISQNQIF
jgi:hypothetical protein